MLAWTAQLAEAVVQGGKSRLQIDVGDGIDLPAGHGRAEVAVRNAPVARRIDVAGAVDEEAQRRRAADEVAEDRHAHGVHAGGDTGKGIRAAGAAHRDPTQARIGDRAERHRDAADGPIPRILLPIPVGVDVHVSRDAGIVAGTGGRRLDSCVGAAGQPRGGSRRSRRGGRGRGLGRRGGGSRLDSPSEEANSRVTPGAGAERGGGLGHHSHHSDPAFEEAAGVAARRRSLWRPTRSKSWWSISPALRRLPSWPWRLSSLPLWMPGLTTRPRSPVGRNRQHRAHAIALTTEGATGVAKEGVARTAATASTSETSDRRPSASADSGLKGVISAANTIGGRHPPAIR